MITPVAWQTGENYIKFRQTIFSNKAFLAKVINLPFDIFPEAYIDTCVAIFEKFMEPHKDNCFLAKQYNKRVTIKSIDDISDVDTIPFTYVLNNPDYKVYTDIHNYKLQEKLKTKHIINLGSLTNSTQGIVESFFNYADCQKAKDYLPYVVGQVYRYQFIEESKKYIDFSSSSNLTQFYTSQRILIRRIVSRADRLMATFVSDSFVSKKDVNPFIITANNYSPYYLLANINSRFHSFMYINFSTLATKDDFRQTTLAELEKIPICLIKFSTLQSLRKTLLDEAIQIYQQYITNGELEGIQSFVDHRLLKEQSDVVHDLLAYLAEQMIEMNKRKNEEIKGFLKWIEREIGSEIDSLVNKTAVKEYHEHDFNQLLEVLKKNRNKVSIDPSERKTQELLENQFAKSMLILEPLKTRIKATDELIDEIVYRLYGLSEDEIKIVKGENI